MLTRRFDGGDDRILAYDAGWGSGGTCRTQATFQARGYYWCNVTAADAGFFERITLGPPYPASDVPARGGLSGVSDVGDGGPHPPAPSPPCGEGSVRDSR